MRLCFVQSLYTEKQISYNTLDIALYTSNIRKYIHNINLLEIIITKHEQPKCSFTKKTINEGSMRVMYKYYKEDKIQKIKTKIENLELFSSIGGGAMLNI